MPLIFLSSYPTFVFITVVAVACGTAIRTIVFANFSQYKQTIKQTKYYALHSVMKLRMKKNYF